MSRLVMYVGGLGPYCEVNGIIFPEKTVVEIEETNWPAMHRRRKFIEVKGIQLFSKTEFKEFKGIKEVKK